MAEEDEPTVRVLVEIPKGSRNKYELNQETGELELDRRLFAAVSYPTEYGFVKETRTAEDEEAEELDALVVVEEPTFPGCVIPIRPIALLRMYDDGEPNHKVVGVPLSDPAWDELQDVGDLPDALGQEIVHFFEVYTDLRGKQFEIEGWADREAALDEIRAGRERYRSEGG